MVEFCNPATFAVHVARLSNPGRSATISLAALLPHPFHLKNPQGS
jgi:hypothetical protein